MKLSTARVQRTLSQLEEQTMFQDARAIPDDNPAIPRLNELFGDHTFFINGDGLHIVEPAEIPSGSGAGRKGRQARELERSQPHGLDASPARGDRRPGAIGSRRDGRKDETEER